MSPSASLRRFFELALQNYRKEGYMGCLLGGLGQELSGVSEVFRRKIEGCFSDIAKRIAVCLDEAKQRGGHPSRFQHAPHGQPAGGLLGGRRPSQPAAGECRAADRHARLLLPVGRTVIAAAPRAQSRYFTRTTSLRFSL